MGVIAGLWLCQAAFAGVCSSSTLDAVSSDLASAQKEKIAADTRVQEDRDMYRSIRGGYNVEQEEIDQALETLTRAENADAVIKRRIAADQDCLGSSACAGVVSIKHVSGRVMLERTRETLEAGLGCGLESGDVLRTGKDGSADLVILAGKRTLHLGPGMEFKVPAVDTLSHLLDDPESALVSPAG